MNLEEIKENAHLAQYAIYRSNFESEAGANAIFRLVTDVLSLIELNEDLYHFAEANFVAENTSGRMACNGCGVDLMDGLLKNGTHAARCPVVRISRDDND